MRISVYGSAELQSVILSMRGMDRALAKQLRAATQRAVKPIWQESVRGNVTSRLENRVLGNTATTLVRDDNVVLRAGASSKRLRGGASVAELVHSAEFGADRKFKRRVDGRGPGKPYERRTRGQFRPRNLKGYTVYPAAADAIPRIASLWVQTTIRTFLETFEGRG
jgi:hypothetical protein